MSDAAATERGGGLYAFLRLGFVYRAFQLAVGASRGWRLFATEDARIQKGERVLDVGCGVGDLLDHLPADVEYFGYDVNEDYIRLARERHPGRGVFLSQGVDGSIPRDWPPMDVVVAVGLLHHLTDAEAAVVLAQAHDHLKPGGRFCSIDPCFAPSQSRLSRALVARDRGMHVRNEAEYPALAARHFARVESRVEHHRLRIPYSHLIMRCYK
jgi:SAM-dependent methyltransferase